MPEPADGLMPKGLEPGAGIEGLKGPEDYPALLAAMSARGWSDADVGAVSRGNLLGFLRRTLPCRRALELQSAAPPSASSVAPLT